MNSTAAGIFTLIAALLVIGHINSHPGELNWLKQQYLAIRGYYCESHPERIWLLCVLICVMVAYIGGWVVEL